MTSCLSIKIVFLKPPYPLLKTEETILYTIYSVYENKEKSVFITNHDRALSDMNVTTYSLNIMHEHLLVREHVYF